MWRLLLLAGIGGFFGTCCRFLVNRLFVNIWKTNLPLATFTVNIVGCFIFGLIFGILNKNGVVAPRAYALLIVGFCGGFTTFSTFSFETFTLGLNGESIIALLYVVVSVILGILALWFGMAVTRN